MKEIHFAAEVKKACDTFQCWYYKIPDAHTMERFTPQKPFDAFIMYQGNFFALEFKMSKMKNFQIDKIKEHQILGLEKAFLNGGFGAILINFRMSEEKINRTFAITTEQWKKIIALEELASRKSIPYSFFEDLKSKALVFEVERLHLGEPKKLHWHIEAMLHHLRALQ